MLADRLHRTRTDTDGNDPSFFASVRLSGSPIARDLEKYTEMFTEGVKCWRIDCIGHGRTRLVSLCVGSTERKSARERLRTDGHDPSLFLSFRLSKPDRLEL